jgi:hypothetical protein
MASSQFWNEVAVSHLSCLPANRKKRHLQFLAWRRQAPVSLKLTSIIAVSVLILASASAATVQAQALNGAYGGAGEGVDINGTILHQITKWRFTNGSLTAFREIITFPDSNSIVACTFTPTGSAPFPYSTGGPQTASPIIVVSYGCPHPSTNERAEAIVIVPEDGGKQFSYIEFNPFSTQVFDEDPPAHFSGQAVSR